MGGACKGLSGRTTKKRTFFLRLPLQKFNGRILWLFMFTDVLHYLSPSSILFFSLNFVNNGRGRAFFYVWAGCPNLGHAALLRLFTDVLHYLSPSSILFSLFFSFSTTKIHRYIALTKSVT